VLALVLASVLAFRMEELATLGRAMPEAAITAGAPADWSEGEAAALSLAFQAAFQAIDEGRADFDTSLDMYREIMDAASKAPQGLLTRDDLLRLTRALEAVAGVSRSDTAPGDIATLSAGDASCLISS